MTPKEIQSEKIYELVDSFFIGGGGDPLESPHMTKADLAHAIEHLVADLVATVEAANVNSALWKRDKEAADQKLEKLQAEAAHLDQCNTEFIKIHSDQAQEICSLRRLMGHWSTVELALKWQEQVLSDLEAAKAEIERLKADAKVSCDYIERWEKRAEAAEAEVKRLKAQVEKEHECARELQDGLLKQYAAFAKELDEKDAEIKRLKVDIAGRSRITLEEQHKKEVALLQNSAYREVLEWIAGQSDLFFAECSQAEEIVARCRKALGPPSSASSAPTVMALRDAWLALISKAVIAPQAPQEFAAMSDLFNKVCGVAEKPKPPYLPCGCLIVQTAQGQIGDHRDGCTEKRVGPSPKCFLCDAEAVGKIGAEPRCGAHV